ncbi:MAG TPA: twin-arginine translocation signal domain-containing protein, partial [Bryobacteraceae bacterium]|nr:twin-arginine translocation signal domain-containing protein [Bryobacteraceae bacterium]
MDRRDFLRTAAATGAATLARAALAQTAFRRMNVGTARVDVTPDKPRICASGDKPDPPRAYAPLISRCMTLFDGTRRMAIVNYPFNCLDVATPILRERCERELRIGPEYLVLLATHNHQGPI